ncbi:MAG: hypothetical protein QXF56_05505 [Candidatus Micrarchaeia archaeon]
MRKTIEGEEDNRKFYELFVERRVLERLSNPQFQVKQLAELIRNPTSRILITPAVVDRVGEMMHGEYQSDTYVRKFATNTYIEILKKNPELATKERMNNFFELINDGNPEVRANFFKNLRAPLPQFKTLSTDMRVEILSKLHDPHLEVRVEARKAIEKLFGISPEVSRALSDEMLKFNFPQRRQAFRLLENLLEELEKTKMDRNAVFEEIRKITKGVEIHEFEDFKFAAHMARNLLVGNGDIESFNRCLELSCEAYKEMNKKMKKGSEEWGRMLEKLFVTWIPELSEQMGYSHLALGLEKVVDEIKKEEPDVFTRSVFEILKYGKS